MNGPELRVDREVFLALVVAASAQSCAKGADGTPASAPIVVAPVEPVAGDAGSAALAESAGARDVAEPPEAPSACEAENERGDVDCAWVRSRKLGGPSCEGASGTCDLLVQGYAYRPRAAQVAAACFERLGTSFCSIRARQKCFEQAVKAACPEPRYDEQCEAKLGECAAAGIRPTYTKEDCARAMSALKGPDRAWALSAMGPSAEGKCKLMFTVF